VGSPLSLVVLASGVQGGHVRASGYETLMLGMVIAALVVACVPIAIYLRRETRRPKPVRDQWQALTVMGELCPHGWQAHVTLYGWGAPLPDDAPPARIPPVELEWKQLGEEPGEIVVTRRVWAATIGEALQRMVDDRRTDIAIEQIEQSVTESGDVEWSD
jgi:hypothetical protein